MIAKRIWHLICVNTILSSSYGHKVVKARPNKGKYIYSKELPEYVRSAFNINDHNCIDSFKTEDIIPVYESHGAKVEKIDSLHYRISFEVSHNLRGIKNPWAKENVKTMLRDEMGKFIKRNEKFAS